MADVPRRITSGRSRRGARRPAGDRTSGSSHLTRRPPAGLCIRSHPEREHVQTLKSPSPHTSATRSRRCRREGRRRDHLRRRGRRRRRRPPLLGAARRLGAAVLPARRRTRSPRASSASRPRCSTTSRSARSRCGRSPRPSAATMTDLEVETLPGRPTRTPAHPDRRASAPTSPAAATRWSPPRT